MSKVKPIHGVAETARKEFTPGSIIIRPTREDAEKDPEAFYALLAALRGPDALSLEKIAEITGDTTQNPKVNVSKRITNKAFSPRDRSLILRHIFDGANLITGTPRRALRGIADAFYFAGLNFWNAKETSQDKARAQLLGTYKFWRYSVEHEDEYVFGKMEFEESPTRAVIAKLVQVKRPHQGEQGVTEEFVGHLFRLSHMFFVIFSREKTNDVRVTLLPLFKPGDVGTDVNPRSIFAGRSHHAIHLDGFGLGIDGGKGFFSPVHMCLVDDVDELAILDEQLDVIREGDHRLPDRVVKMLRRNGPLRRL